MTLFANPGSATITKYIQKVKYVCPPGELVDIPERYAYVIEAERTPLVRADNFTAQATVPTEERKPVVVDTRRDQSQPKRR